MCGKESELEGLEGVETDEASRNKNVEVGMTTAIFETKQLFHMIIY